MKKLLASVLCAAMALSLAACGGKAESAAAPTQAPAPEAAQSAGQTFSFAATIEPTVLVDEQGVKITASELRYTNYSVELVLALENNSGKDLSFHSGTLGYGRNSVNGYMVDGLYVGADVPTGKKANETASINLDELLLYGITGVADIEMAFDINDSDYNDYLQTEPATVKTSLADSYDYATDTYQQVMQDGTAIAALGGKIEHFATDEIYNEQGVRIVSELFAANADGEPLVFVELENTADQMVTVYVKDPCLNGLQVRNGIWSSDDINVGKRRVVALQPYSMLDQEYWDAYGLGTVGEVSFTLGLRDADDNALCDDAAITLSVPGADAAYRSDGDLVYSGDGLRIMHMATVPDAWSGSNDIHLLLLAENGTQKQIRFNVGDDTLSANGYMTDFFCIGPTLAPGKSGVFDVKLDGDSLAENGIEAAEDIQTLELTFELMDENYNKIASPAVTIGAGSAPVGDTAPTADGAGSGTEAADAVGVTPDFKELMDSYEAFFDEYAAFMEKYNSSDDSASMLMDYLSFLSRYAEAMQKLDEIDTDSLSAADMAYYTQVMLRISSKLAGTIG